MVAINAKLQAILNGLATQAGGTSSTMYQNFLLALNSSDTLLTRYNNAVTAGTLTKIVLLTSNTGFMYSNGTEFTISSYFLSSGFKLGEVTYKIAHELSHCENDAPYAAEYNTWVSNTKALVGTVSPNVTNALLTYLDFSLRDEGQANIRAYNSLMNAKIIANGGVPLTAEQRLVLTDFAITGKTSIAQFINPTTGAFKPDFTFDANGYVIENPAAIATAAIYCGTQLTPTIAGTADSKYSFYYAGQGLQWIANMANGKTLILDYNNPALSINTTVLGRALSVEEINDYLAREHFGPQTAPTFTSITFVDPMGKYKSEFTKSAFGGARVKTTMGIGETLTHIAIKDYFSTSYNALAKNLLAKTVISDTNNTTHELTIVTKVYNTADIINNTALLSQVQVNTTSAGAMTTLIDANGDGVFETTLTGVDANWSGVVDTQKTGTAYANSLTGTAASDELLGLAGNDTLTGLAGGDMLDGGAGSDSMVGGAGDDVYVVDNTGDRVTELANEGTDTVNSSITYTLGSNVERLVLTGTAAINGTGNALDNQLIGNSASNTLTGGAGNDTLSGWQGADTLVGGAGNDIYLFARNDGADQLLDSDATAGNLDVLWFNAGVDNSQLWFKQSGVSLEISVIGTNDKVVVQNWYNGAANQVEQIKSSNGKTLLNTQVSALVAAMSAFAPPAAGELTLSPTYQTALNGVIAANWQ